MSTTVFSTRNVLVESQSCSLVFKFLFVCGNMNTHADGSNVFRLPCIFVLKKPPDGVERNQAV